MPSARSGVAVVVSQRGVLPAIVVYDERMAAGDYKRIFAIVKKIPRGRVATYGQVALLAGLGGHARRVGYALSALEDEGVPWHRVINARGEVSLRSEPGCDDQQRKRLEAEGVVFDECGRVALKTYQWRRGL